jgi:Lon-like ATP-dependent protease
MTSVRESLRVPVEQLRWRPEPASFSFESTAELAPLDAIVGQERGVAALRFGMGMSKKGYNVVVTGAPRSGRLSTVKKLLSEFSSQKDDIHDLCFVNNFKDSESPLLLTFTSGQGAPFKKAVQDFLDRLKRDIPELFESQQYIARKKEIMEAHERKTREFFMALEKKVKDAGFVLVNMQVGQTQRPDVAPIIDGEPMHILTLEQRVENNRFPRDEFEQLKVKHHELKEEIDAIFLEIRDLQKEVKRKYEEIDRLLFTTTARGLMLELLQTYTEKKITQYFEDMLEHMADNLDLLRAMGQHPSEGQQGMFMPPSAEMVLNPYQVNLLVDNAQTEGQPVIIESFPTYRNLFGSIERVWDRSGVWRADFTKIKAGSFMKANGGFLVFNLLDALMEPGVWPTLKRALKTSEIEIQTFDPWYFVTSSGLKPETIPMRVKVVVLADSRLYSMLQYYDEDMSKIFKVRADFDTSMERDEQAVEQFCRFVRAACEENAFRPFDREAVAALLEQAVRMAGRQEKISTAFPQLEDLLAEADFYAAQEEPEGTLISARHVAQALEARIYRSNRVEERIQEMIDRGSLFIDVEGAKVGQVNGLAVYSMGDYAFGKPSRITVETSMGKEGIINIEREAELSGAFHNKGVLILAGYLRGKFAQDMPLTLAASIAFEQSYGGVDGDSASSTELYALLSSLADAPLKQDIAVTGSVNQKGEIQPIGGVNEKIEGFYHCCKKLKLTGEQGVLIPAANVKDLMLKQEVLDAVVAGTFSIWAASRIEEGVELLTGVPAGVRGKDGYPKRSIFGRSEAKLKQYAEGLKAFGEKDEGKKKPEKKRSPASREER